MHFLKKHGFDPGRHYREDSRYHKILDSLYYNSQTWCALYKALIECTIAKNKGEFDKEIHYAFIIQKLQKRLNLGISEFKCLEDLNEEI